MIVRQEETDRDPAERLDDRILAAALRSIEQLGDGFTFEDVADRAGTSVAEVAECCNSRSSLVLRAYHLHIWRMVEVLHGAPYEDDPDGALSSFIYNLSGLLAISPTFVNALASNESWADVDVVVSMVCELLDDDRDEETMEYSLTHTVTMLLHGFTSRISEKKSSGSQTTETFLAALRSLRPLTVRGEEEIPHV